MATVPDIQNETLILANTEYPVTIPASSQRYDFQCRTAYDIRYAFESGAVAAGAAAYMTLKAGGAFTSEFIPQSVGQQTIYFASSQAGVVVELLSHPRSDS